MYVCIDLTHEQDMDQGEFLSGTNLVLNKDWTKYTLNIPFPLYLLL